MAKIKDDDIRMDCPDKATCFEHLHNQTVLRAYRKECKISKKYKETLETIREIAVDIYTNDVYENSDIKAEKIIRKIDEVLKIQKEQANGKNSTK